MRFPATTSRTAPATALAAALLTAAACNGDKAFAPGTDPFAPRAGGYTADELGYFDETAFGFRFGADPLAGVPGTPRVTKWDHDVRVAVVGPVTATDLAYIDQICADITAAIGGPVRVSRDTTGTANVALIFQPQNFGLVSLGTVLSEAHVGYVGYADPSFDAAQHIDSATVLVASELTFGYRYEVIRHELTHAIGLTAHSHLPYSIMTTTANGLAQYAAIDVAGIEMLYRPEVKAGMTAAEAKAALHTLARR